MQVHPTIGLVIGAIEILVSVSKLSIVKKKIGSDPLYRFLRKQKSIMRMLELLFLICLT